MQTAKPTKCISKKIDQNWIKPGRPSSGPLVGHFLLSFKNIETRTRLGPSGLLTSNPSNHTKEICGKQEEEEISSPSIQQQCVLRTHYVLLLQRDHFVV